MLINVRLFSSMHWRNTALLLALAVSGMTAIDQLPITVSHLFFSGPSAHIAGFLLGVPVLEEGNAAPPFWLLPHPILDLHVGRVCSGLNFFLLTIILMTWSTLGAGRQWFWYLPIVPFAYATTLLANGIRLVSVFHARIAAEWLLPPQFFSMVHLVAGGLVFLTLIILLYHIHEHILHAGTS